MHRRFITALNLAKPLPPDSKYTTTPLPQQDFAKFANGQLDYLDLHALCKQSIPNASTQLSNTNMQQHPEITLVVAPTEDWPFDPFFPPTALELLAIHRGGANSSTLLQTISKLSHHQDIVDIVTNAFYQPHTTHQLSPPHQNLYHYETRQWVCDTIQQRPIIVDQTFQASFARGGNEFAPTNLRIVQPAFIPLICAMDQAIQDFFTKPKEERALAHNDDDCSEVDDDDDDHDPYAATLTTVPTAPKPMNEMCQAIFNPPKPCSNLFVFSGQAGLGKTEMLNVSLHRAALMGKNVLLVKTPNKMANYTLVDFATSTVRTLQRNYNDENAGATLLQMFSDISGILDTYCAGQDTLVVLDPPEFSPSASFAAFNDFIKLIQPFGDQHDGTLFAFEKFYTMLSQQHPNAFFLAAHSASLPRPGTLLTQKNQPLQASTDCGDSPADEEEEASTTMSEGQTAFTPFAVSGPCVPLHLRSFPHFRFPGLRLTQTTMDKTAKLMLLATKLGKQKVAQNSSQAAPSLKTTQSSRKATASTRKNNKSPHGCPKPLHSTKEQQQQQQSAPTTTNPLVQSVDAASSVDLSKLEEFLYPHVSDPALAVLLRRVVPLKQLAEFELKLSQVGVHGAFTSRSYFRFFSYHTEQASSIAWKTTRLSTGVATRYQLVLPKTEELVDPEPPEIPRKAAMLEWFETRHLPKQQVFADKFAPPYNQKMCDDRVTDNCRYLGNVHDFNDSLDRPSTTLSCSLRSAGYYPGVPGTSTVLSKSGARPATVVQSMLRCASFLMSVLNPMVRGNTHLAQFAELATRRLHRDFPSAKNNNKKGNNDESSTWAQYHAHLAASGGQGTFAEIFPSNGSATYSMGDGAPKLLLGEQIERLYGLGRHIAALPKRTEAHDFGPVTSPYNSLMDLASSVFPGLDFAVIDEGVTQDTSKFYGIHICDVHSDPQQLSAVAADYENLCKLYLGIINTGIVKGGKPKRALLYGGMIHLTPHDAANAPGLEDPSPIVHPYVAFDIMSLFYPDEVSARLQCSDSYRHGH